MKGTFILRITHQGEKSIKTLNLVNIESFTVSNAGALEVTFEGASSPSTYSGVVQQYSIITELD